MLKTLHVSNLGVLGDVEVDLPDGLVCLTGETGAGKSLLVDAIKLLLGARADASDIRQGENTAVVEAVFEVPGDADAVLALEASGYGVEDGEVRLRRVLTADGRGKAWIQGRLATARELRELGGMLVSVAGQHAFIGLGMPRERLAMLDAFAGLGDSVAAFAARFAAWKEARGRLDTLRAREADRSARLDYLGYVIEQIDGVDLKVGELDERTADASALRGAERLRELAGNVAQSLYDGSEPVFDAMGRALQEAREMVRIDPRAGEFATRLESAQIEVRELAREFGAYGERVDLDPARLAQVEERLEALKTLVRRFGGSEQAVLDTLQAARLEHSELAVEGETGGRLEADVEVLRTEVESLAASLSTARHEAADRMSALVTDAVRGLAMAGATVNVRVESAEISDTGGDRVAFRIETNPGEGWGEVADVASGGELSRVTLALYSALSASVGTPVMVYDEIDTGVSGGVAERMGEVLGQAARSRQILVVTHHGQVAAQAAAHFLVEKHTMEGRTVASLRRLDGNDRVLEIARLIGGRTLTDAVMGHARELVNGTSSSVDGTLL